MSTRTKITDIGAFMRGVPHLFRVARGGAITAVAEQQARIRSPLGAVSHTAPAEAREAHPGGVIRGISPCAATLPHRDVPRPDRLRELADRARQEMADPFGPHGVLPDWSDCVEWTPLSATGDYCAAVGPDVIVALLDERDRYRDALTVIADNPCATLAGPMGCDERIGTLGPEWCSYCRARAALDAEVRG